MKKSLCILLILALVLTAVSCGIEKTETQKPGTVIEKDSEGFVIIDQAGREVYVPKKVKTVAYCYRVPARVLISLGMGDSITGAGKVDDFLKKVQPSLADVPSVGTGVIDIEALAELAPDVVFHKASDKAGLDAAGDVGVAAIGLSMESQEDIVVALDIIGKVCGTEKKARQFIDYYNDKLKEDKKLTKKINKKKTVLMMGSAIGKVADGSMLQGFMIEKAGGINVAADLSATETWPTAGTEQIFEWDPEYIFISSESTDYNAKDILSNETWSEIKAVKNKHVYEMPAPGDSWEFPGAVSALGIDYMINKMYPELLGDDALEKNVNDFYDLFYGTTFDREDLGY